jgi:hydroxyacyl-ACP dehydratase HTD2-like protein with hotdog domain
MWAGGELRWAGAKKNLLRLGQRVSETTVVRSAEGKRTRAGEEMVVVGVEKRFENEAGWAVVDRR